MDLTGIAEQGALNLMFIHAVGSGDGYRQWFYKDLVKYDISPEARAFVKREAAKGKTAGEIAMESRRVAEKSFLAKTIFPDRF